MFSNCPRCGSSLTIREAIQNWCHSCSRSTAKTPAGPDLVNGRTSLSLVRKNFDLLVVDELRKSSLTPAA
jgi:ribosomal protein L37AE/L43A